MKEPTYKIVRKYAPGSGGWQSKHPDHNKVIDTGLTLDEAQTHCKDPATHEKGVWFDCYYEEDRRETPGPSITKALSLMYPKG